MHRLTFLLRSVLVFSAISSAAADTGYKIYSDGDQVRILAGDLKRTIYVKGGEVCTTSIAVAGEEILAGTANELSFCMEKAVPNREPLGAAPEGGGSVAQEAMMSDSTDHLRIKEEGGSIYSGQVTWKESRVFTGRTWGGVFNFVNCRHSSPEAGIRQLIIRARALNDVTLGGVAINMAWFNPG